MPAEPPIVVVGEVNVNTFRSRRKKEREGEKGKKKSESRRTYYTTQEEHDKYVRECEEVELHQIATSGEESQSSDSEEEDRQTVEQCSNSF
jgi:hypothetical protein